MKAKIEIREELDFTDQLFHTEPISADSGAGINSILLAIKDIVNNILEFKQYWSFDFQDQFWTHKFLFKVNGKCISSQLLFFKNIFDSYPQISFGYDFYSSFGYASMFRVLYDHSDNKNFYQLYPKAYSIISQQLKCQLIEFLRQDERNKNNISQCISQIDSLECPEIDVFNQVPVNDVEERQSLDFFLLQITLPLSQKVFDI